MNIDDLSPTYYGEDRIAVTVRSGQTLLAGHVVLLDFDYSRSEPEGVVLPIAVAVQPAFGDGTGYKRKVFTRNVPSAFAFVPVQAGDYLVTVRESAHNRWQGRLIVRIGG